MHRFLASLAVLMPVFAHAAEATEQAATTTSATDALAGNPSYAGMLPLVMIIVVFYFLLIRPQQKRMKEHQSMLGGLKKGDEVVTGGGIVARIVKVADDRVTLEIAKGVEVTALKGTLTGLSSQMTGTGTASKSVKNDNVTPGLERVANDN